MKKFVIYTIFVTFLLFSCNQKKNIDPIVQKKINNSLINAQREYDSCKYTSSLKLLNSAKKLIPKSDSIFYKNFLLKILNKRGKIFRILGRYSESWIDFQEVLLIAEEKKVFNPDIFNAYRGLGVLFFYYQECSDIALDYFNRALLCATDEKDSAYIYYALSESYIVNARDKQNKEKVNKEKIDFAEKYFSLFSEMILSKNFNKKFPKEAKEMEPFIWESKAKLIILKNKLNNDTIFDLKIISNFDISIGLNMDMKPINKYQIGNGIFEKGKYFSGFKEYQDSAFFYLDSAYKIANSIGNNNLVMRAAEEISNIYCKKQKFYLAYQYLFISDSIYSTINNSQLYILNTNFITQQKNRKETELKNNRYVLISSGIAIIFLLITIVLLYRNLNYRKRAQKKIQNF